MEPVDFMLSLPMKDAFGDTELINKVSFSDVEYVPVVIEGAKQAVIGVVEKIYKYKQDVIVEGKLIDKSYIKELNDEDYSASIDFIDDDDGTPKISSVTFIYAH